MPSTSLLRGPGLALKGGMGSATSCTPLTLMQLSIQLVRGWFEEACVGLAFTASPCSGDQRWTSTSPWTQALIHLIPRG